MNCLTFGLNKDINNERFSHSYIPEPNANIKGKTVIITGANSGIFQIYLIYNIEKQMFSQSI